MSSTRSHKIAAFRAAVWRYYRANGRHDLPWRKMRDPYRILVSEIMLQQTQVERAIPFYAAFLKKFPTAEKLARAPLSEVLKLWQGLGYNRRAKMLHEAAKQIAAGGFPEAIPEIEKLRGVGPYTARAVAAFAFNKDSIFIETNIRTATMHHFFPKKDKVSDAEIEKILKAAYPKGKARKWYSALMDYGSHLKRSGVRTNHRVKGYAKQARFDGSLRQARGAVLRALLHGPRSSAALAMLLGRDREAQAKAALAGLAKEGLITLSGGTFRLPR